MSEADDIRAEVEQYGMDWIRQQAVDPWLEENDVTIPRVMEHFKFKDNKTAKAWLKEHGFTQSHMAIDRESNNRHVQVWKKAGP